MSPHQTVQPEQRATGGPTSAAPPVVAIGASEGGLEALATLLAQIPPETGLAWVAVHASSDPGARLVEVLQARASLPVEEVTETVALEPDRIYVVPAAAGLEAVDSHLRLADTGLEARERTPVDHLLCTLAETHGGEPVAVVLTGSGTDGTAGLRAVKERGGLTVVQDPGEAEHDGMPQSALAMGLVDLVLPLDRIAPEIVSYFRTRPRVEVPGPAEEAAGEELQGRLVEKILVQARARTGRDFRRYRRSTVLRRIARRMQLRHVEELGAYLELVQEERRELDALVDALLITVTGFFRDAEVFDALEREVIPRLFDGKGPDDEVRVWSVGCATGEEAYSLAILLLEEADRRPRPPRIQILASDLHEPSLERARDGFYADDIAAAVSPERLRRFFSQEPGGYRVRPEVRDRVLFARHDLLSAPPYSRLDLVACRNLLLYFQPDLQNEVIERFHWALRSGGVLVLTPNEVRDWGELFRPLERGAGLYQRADVPSPQPRLPRGATSPADGVDPDDHRPSHGAVHQRVVERYAPPSVLVRPDDRVAHVSEHAGRYLLHAGGAPSSRVDRLVRPELRLELRARLEEARERSEPRSSPPIPVSLDGGDRPVVLHVRPALQPESEEPGWVLVLFEERAEEELSPWRRSGVDGTGDPTAADPERVLLLESRLEQTRQQLQTLTEVHETTEEELRTANEELQSSNEELRAALEELETSNEELESTNEELQTVAAENRNKASQLEALSADLERLLLATEIGTLFLDPDLRIVRFTPRITHLFHARPSDRGRPLADLDHRLDYDELLEDARAVAGGAEPTEREVQDQDGRWYLARALPHQGEAGSRDGVVLVFVDITTRKRLAEAEEASRVKSQFLSTMSHELRTPLTAVIGISDLMETEVLGPMNEKQKRHLGRVKDAAWHLVGIIEEVLSFSRSEAGKERLKLADADLAQVARDVADMIQPTADRDGIEVRVETGDEPVPVRTDVGKLTQIATNLVGNAVKFASGRVSIAVAGSDGWVELGVRDDGPGIPPDRIDEIFEPFTQLDGSSTREKGGTGLGLTIARRQARLLGGDVLVESRPREGSTFTLRLPRECDEAARPEAE